MLEIKNLSVGYCGRDVLSGIDLKIEKGSFRAILGKNGSGKSTLVKCVAQNIKYSGQILLDGEELSKLPPLRRAKSVAILPQTLPIPALTVYETVALGRSPYTGLSGKLGDSDKSKIEAAGRLCGIWELRGRMLSELSGGERQRVFLAMTLAQNAPYLILDEPTTYMDLTYEASFLKLLQTLPLNSGAMSLMVVMHNLTLAVKYASELLIIDGGKAMFDGSVQSCLATESIERIFGVKRYMTEGGELFFSV